MAFKQAAEREIAENVNRILADWIRVEREQATRNAQSYREEIDAFVEWCGFYGVRPAAGGHIAAAYCSN